MCAGRLEIVILVPVMQVRRSADAVGACVNGGIPPRTPAGRGAGSPELQVSGPYSSPAIPSAHSALRCAGGGLGCLLHAGM